jgi:uncharacterized glyoxalase superfamily protein PhnB
MDTTNVAAQKAAELGINSVTPYLICSDGSDLIDFYERAFGAQVLFRLDGENGGIMHACLSINGSSVMLSEVSDDCPVGSPKTLGTASPVTLHLIVDDVDAAMDRALSEGAKLIMPVTDMFWGDRYGLCEDPSGHRWSFATPQKSMTPEEIKAAMKAETGPALA